MSSEEDPELRDLVALTLENSGVLSKIRAELRASVFLALEEQVLSNNKMPYINNSLKDFLKTSEGSLVACLVREFLEFFSLDFTLSVFDPETCNGKDYDYGGRNKLITDLQIKNLNGKKGPLLAQILQLVQTSQNDSTSTHPNEESNKGDETFVMSPDKRAAPSRSTNVSDIEIGKVLNLWDASQGTVCDTAIKSNFKVDSVEETSNLKQTNKMSSISSDDTPCNTPVLGDIVTQISDSKQKKVKKNGDNNPSKGSSSDFGSLETSWKPSGSSLASLGNLPPLLGSNKSIMEPVSFALHKQDKDINQLKSLMNGIDASDNNYDEDFQSSTSGSGHEGRSKNSWLGSDSEEIEEDIGSGIDDLLSNPSGLEDLTVDATLSNLSGLGDFMENV